MPRRSDFRQFSLRFRERLLSFVSELQWTLPSARRGTLHLSNLAQLLGDRAFTIIRSVGSLNCKLPCTGVRYAKCSLRNCRNVMVSLQRIAITLFQNSDKDKEFSFNFRQRREAFINTDTTRFKIQTTVMGPTPGRASINFSTDRLLYR